MTALERARKVLQTLVKGREYVAGGWVQDAYHKRQGNKHAYCMIGGLARAAGGGVDGNEWAADHELFDGAEALLDRAVARVTKKRFYRHKAPTFNDAVGQTQERVLRAYDVAIKMAEKNLALVEKGAAL